MARLGDLEDAIVRLVDDAVALRYVGMGLEGERGEFETVGSAIKRIASRFEKKFRRLIEDIWDLQMVMEGVEGADRGFLDLWRERQTLLTALDRHKADVTREDPRVARFNEVSEKLADTPVKTLVGALTMLTTALREMETFRYPPDREEVDVRMIRQAIDFLERKYEAGGGQKSAA